MLGKSGYYINYIFALHFSTVVINELVIIDFPLHASKKGSLKTVIKLTGRSIGSWLWCSRDGGLR